LKHFQTLTGTDDADSLADLLCDIHHLCDRDNLSFQTALDRGRQRYNVESSEDSPTRYMATFNTPVGIATELFHATSPEEALQKARKYADDPQLTEVDIEPLEDGSGYCVQQITITDDKGQQHAFWQTDEYRLKLAAPNLLQALEKQIAITRAIIDAWNNTDKVHGAVQDLINDLEHRSQSAREVIEAYENSDLAGPIEELEELLNENLAAIAQAKGGAA